MGHGYIGSDYRHGAFGTAISAFLPWVRKIETEILAGMSVRTTTPTGIGTGFGILTLLLAIVVGDIPGGDRDKPSIWPAISVLFVRG